MYNPIWKDYYVTLGTNKSYQYKIRIADKIVYEGVAHKRPGMGYVAVKINDIVADYLQIELKLLRNDFILCGEVGCQVLIGDEVIANVTFYANWSYDDLFDPEEQGLSYPINSRVMVETPVPCSALQGEEYELEMESDGYVFYVVTDERKSSYCMFDLQSIGVQAKGKFQIFPSYSRNAVQYEVVESCAKYALYYVNAYGGVDMLLMEGNHSEKDSLIRHTRSVEYDNREVSNRGRGDYAIELTKTLTLHTSWLSDDEASRMHHLLNSPQVCLFDIETQQMIPVLLKNTTTEYKTYKGNGGKLVNYAIEVEYANKMMRR